MTLSVLASMWVIIHNIIDKIINFFFGLLYDDSKKKNIPEITNPILLKSASSLAEAIRKREVSKLVYMAVIYFLLQHFYSEVFNIIGVVLVL